MKEQPPQYTPETTMEQAPEKFPSREEIKSKLEMFCHGREYKELRVLSDEKGVRLYEIESTDELGEKIEYNFQKAKYDYTDPKLPPTLQFSASIHSTTFNGDMPCGGECVANYLDGKWYPL
jgi:hypothetical protein